LGKGRDLRVRVKRGQRERERASEGREQRRKGRESVKEESDIVTRFVDKMNVDKMPEDERLRCHNNQLGADSQNFSQPNNS
jgi:hypothetical protein